MENTSTEITMSNTDLQKLIHTYIGILGVKYNTPYEDIIFLLKSNFSLEVTTDDLLTYFTPTLEEFTEDLKLQMNNLK